MDFQLARKPRPSWLCQGWPGFCSNCSLEFKVRSIRLVGIVLSMFCLIERVPYLRFDYYLGDNRHPIISPQGFGDTIHKTRFWGLLGKQRLCQYQVLPPISKSQDLKVIFAGSRSKVCPSASSTPTSPPTLSSTRLGSRATTRSWESTSSPRRAGLR